MQPSSDREQWGLDATGDAGAGGALTPLPTAEPVVPALPCQST